MVRTRNQFSFWMRPYIAWILWNSRLGLLDSMPCKLWRISGHLHYYLILICSCFSKNKQVMFMFYQKKFSAKVLKCGFWNQHFWEPQTLKIPQTTLWELLQLIWNIKLSCFFMQLVCYVCMKKEGNTHTLLLTKLWHKKGKNEWLSP